MHPRNRRSLICPALATGGPACVTSPPASTAEPPAAVANVLEDLDHHLDLRIMIAVARGSFSPLQSDTSATAGAHSELAAGGGTAAGEIEGFLPHRPPVRELGAREPSQGEETVDLVHHAPRRRSRDHERWSTVIHMV